MKRYLSFSKNYLILCLGLMISGVLMAQAPKKPLSYYLPSNVQYDKSIPTPESFLGYHIGDWHITHDQLVYYMKALAAASDRITIQEYARSYEQRPLLLMTITSPKNHKNINTIRTQHLKLVNATESSSLEVEKMPVVIYQGYTIHGNEPSGSNAAPLYAYYLAAAQGAAIEKALENTVVLLDPCYNPDGMNRFASWVNSHQSVQKNGDPNNRELNEAWPRGRTNHYWFDLNRDWLLLQHPESRGRVRKFHEWKPNILTDHHEMGGHSTFFFQPGIQSRINPLIPQKNQELTTEISYFHAKALDDIGSLYFTKEGFDDYYIGKGSTYPDLHGCIGILFEQASSRGHATRTQHGLMDFPFTVRNQVKTSLSTFEAAQNLRVQLLNYQREFYQNAFKEESTIKGYIVTEEHDASRLKEFAQLLSRHKIVAHYLYEDFKHNGKTYKANTSIVIPIEQRQRTLVKGLFDVRTEFTDSLFYDVSAWTMPHAFNLEFATLSTLPRNIELEIEEMPSRFSVPKSDYAYVVKWDDYYAPLVLNFLLKKGVLVKVASKPFTVKGNKENLEFTYGSLLIPVAMQSISKSELNAILDELATKLQDEKYIHPILTGYAVEGVDLGSRTFKSLKLPKILLVVGSGVTSYDAGEVWHLLDQRYEMDLSVVEASRFNSVNLNNYNTVVMVNGNYSGIKYSGIQKLKTWTKQGGVIIGFRSAVKWLEKQKLVKFSTKSVPKNNKSKKRTSYVDSYANQSKVSGAQVIGGAIFEVEMDLTHPLAYGYHRSTMPVFRKGTTYIEPTANFNATPIVFAEKPLLSGYISKPNLKTLGKSAYAFVGSMGKGRVICFSDNTNFRAFWYGTNKLFANAIFFGHTINSSATVSAEASMEAVEEMEESH